MSGVTHCLELPGFTLNQKGIMIVPCIYMHITMVVLNVYDQKKPAVGISLTSSGWYTMEYVSKKTQRIIPIYNRSTISALFYSSWLRIVSIFKLSNQSYRLKPYSSLYSALINSQVFTLSLINASPLSNSAIVFAFCIHMGSLCQQNCTSHLISNDR